jgi:hypothetical protein
MKSRHRQAFCLLAPPFPTSSLCDTTTENNQLYDACVVAHTSAEQLTESLNGIQPSLEVKWTDSIFQTRSSLYGEGTTRKWLHMPAPAARRHHFTLFAFLWTAGSVLITMRCYALGAALLLLLLAVSVDMASSQTVDSATDASSSEIPAVAGLG